MATVVAKTEAAKKKQLEFLAGFTEDQDKVVSDGSHATPSKEDHR